MPDDKQNYIHRIGRVGRADRMGLAISLVSTVKEKVWYHSCPSRGKNCYNTELKEKGGCAIWYDEKQVRPVGEISVTVIMIASMAQVAYYHKHISISTYNSSPLTQQKTDLQYELFSKAAFGLMGYKGASKSH